MESGNKIRNENMLHTKKGLLDEAMGVPGSTLCDESMRKKDLEKWKTSTGLGSLPSLKNTFRRMARA